MANADAFFGATDTGRMRDNNEDAFLAQQLGDGRILACVIDGVGGYEGGEVAAALAKETIDKALQSPSPDPVMQMRLALATANDAIYQHRLKHPHLSSMACVLTLCVADKGNNNFYYAHVGDTRLYLLRDHSLVKLTKDHSFVGYLEDNKKIGEAEAMQHPKRNEINKALGFDPNMAQVSDYIETGSSPFLPGDMLLLCSDGLTDLVDNSTMKAILSREGSLQEKSTALIDAANAAGGKDNITVVLVHNGNKGVKVKKTKPVAARQAPSTLPAAATVTAQPAAPVKKRNRGLIIFLLLLCLILAALAYYLWTNNSQDEAAPAVQSIERGSGEQMLLDSLERSSFIFLDSSYGGGILISDRITIQHDSLYIDGNGTVLRSDSAYRGPLLVAGPQCRYIYLQNLVIEGAAVGLLAQSRNLELKGVTFRDCEVPVQYALEAPDGVRVSGTVRSTGFFKRDSLSNSR